jgi:K+/H+ antiporter YhaU regulatory subunit KhtT
VAPGSPARNQIPADPRLRGQSGLAALAVRRRPDLIPKPAAEMTIMEGDVVIVTGTIEQLAKGPIFSN